MSTLELTTKIAQLQEWEQIMEEAKAEADAIKDELKQLMLNRGVEELEAGEHIIRYTSVISNRFDTTAFKKAHNEIYMAFTKQTTSRRFSIA
jgi:predicted phage-related endonuclease